MTEIGCGNSPLNPNLIQSSLFGTILADFNTFHLKNNQ